MNQTLSCIASGCPHVAKNDWRKTTTCQKTLYLNESDRVTHFCLGWWGKLRCRYFLQIDTSLEWCFLKLKLPAHRLIPHVVLLGFHLNFILYANGSISVLKLLHWWCRHVVLAFPLWIITYLPSTEIFSIQQFQLVMPKNLFTAAHFFEKIILLFFRELLGLKPVSLVKKWVRLRWFGCTKLRLI